MGSKASMILAAGAFALLPALTTTVSAQSIPGVGSLPIPAGLPGLDSLPIPGLPGGGSGGTPSAPPVNFEFSIDEPLDLLVDLDIPGTEGEPGSLVIGLAGTEVRLPPASGGSGGGLPGLDALPIGGAGLPGLDALDPSVLTGLLSGLPIPTGGGGGGGSGGGIPTIPVDLTSLTGALPIGGGVPGLDALPLSPSDLPLDPQDLLGALSGGGAGGGLPALPLDLAGLAGGGLPGLDALPIGGAGLPGLDALPINPTDLLGGGLPSLGGNSGLPVVGGLLGPVLGALPLP